MSKKLKIKTKRVYDEVSNNDGYRILVDKIWPRGVSKENAKLDEWNKNLAPSDELRKWFDHDPNKFKEFNQRYKKELKDKQEDLERIKEIAQDKQVCLLYGAKDKEHNQAAVLKEILKSQSRTSGQVHEVYIGDHF
ncbi:uncharacterized protein YeaO (DUF488 family) [Gillisia sp. Hel_I_86]|uniref:DUF488 domain-containing protein n=1 Tax=Gillisia sp. Hel_I_86 TaxID=1249981 RepID=UPI001198EDF9|nr:DUF488 domain-containing protein [Gillisia sp. Hel_I_86]TVZ28627.1 uncharacterized protein YeaO (DUF488 family) [Gillisia sp. Hel_I_86]